MAKKTLLTLDGLYRKVKAAYITENGIYRKVKKVYITIDGIYRACWAPGNWRVIYHGLATESAENRSWSAAAANGNYALFAGGYGSTLVEAYNKNLVKSTPVGLSEARYWLEGTPVGDYVLFAGGTNGNSEATATVDAYDSNLVMTTIDDMSCARADFGSTSTKHHALFAGYMYSNGSVEVYDENLVHTTLPNTIYLAYMGGASVGEYGLFAGGRFTSDVWAYNADLVLTTPSDLSVERQDLAGASTGNYALFAGGMDGNSAVSAAVDAYNHELVKSMPTDLSVARTYLAGASLDSFALFAGGTITGNYGERSTVDVYDSNLVRSLPDELSSARAYLEGASVGNYALFGGYGNTMDVCTITDEPRVHIWTKTQQTTTNQIPHVIGAQYSSGNSYAYTSNPDGITLTTADFVGMVLSSGAGDFTMELAANNKLTVNGVANQGTWSLLSNGLIQLTAITFSTTSGSTTIYGDKTVYRTGTYVIETFLGEVTSNDPDTYPTSGQHTDGYYYEYKGEVDPPLISFTINGIEHKARANMNWSQWCNSVFNPGDYEINGYYVYYVVDGAYRAVLYNNDVIERTTVIIDGGAYVLAT